MVGAWYVLDKPIKMSDSFQVMSHKIACRNVTVTSDIYVPQWHFCLSLTPQFLDMYDPQYNIIQIWLCYCNMLIGGRWPPYRPILCSCHKLRMQDEVSQPWQMVRMSKGHPTSTKNLSITVAKECQIECQLKGPSIACSLYLIDVFLKNNCGTIYRCCPPLLIYTLINFYYTSRLQSTLCWR